MSDVLEKLFGSAARVKILRLFLFNPHEGFSASRIAKQTGVQKRTANSNAKRLESIGFLYSEKVPPQSKRSRKKQVKAWRLNYDFPFRDALQSLLIRSRAFNTEKLHERIKDTGDIKLLLISGVFVHQPQAPLDICVVGDALNTKEIERIVQDFEQELGTQLRYAILTTAEFEYRYDMFDRFVHEIFTHSNELLIDKFDIMKTEE